MEERAIGIAFLDTGLYPHPDFVSGDNRILAFRDFVNGYNTPYDDNGHGTHVTGIAAGNGYLSGGKYAGISPKAGIISAKILDRTGQGSYQTAASGILWVVRNCEVYNIRIINLSVGTDDRNAPPSLLMAAEAARKKGILIVAAKGAPNSGGRCIAPSALPVGSLEDYCERPYLSEPAFTLAHGKNIVSCLARDYIFKGGSRDRNKIVDKFYIRMSGSSMATPKIAGLAANILALEPSLSPEELKEIILGNGPLYASKTYRI